MHESLSMSQLCLAEFYLPHDYNNYKKMPKKNVGRDGVLIGLFDV